MPLGRTFWILHQNGLNNIQTYFSHDFILCVRDWLLAATGAQGGIVYKCRWRALDCAAKLLMQVFSEALDYG